MLTPQGDLLRGMREDTFDHQSSVRKTLSPCNGISFRHIRTQPSGSIIAENPQTQLAEDWFGNTVNWRSIDSIWMVVFVLCLRLWATCPLSLGFIIHLDHGLESLWMVESLLKSSHRSVLPCLLQEEIKPMKKITRLPTCT